MSEIEHKALDRIRLHGSIWWRDEWGTPAKIANDALLAADAERYPMIASESLPEASQTEVSRRAGR